MNFDQWMSGKYRKDKGGKFGQGLTLGIVTNTKDPDGLGRVKVKLPIFSEEVETDWLRVLSFYGGGGRGSFFLPEVDDEVLLAFDSGDVQFGYVLGGLWNGQDKPPDTNEDGENNTKMIRTRSGHCLLFSDKEGEEKIEILDKSEKNSITWDTKENTIRIIAEKDIILEAPQGKISLQAKELEYQASGNIKQKTDGDMELEAGGNLNAKGSMINLN